MSRADAKNSVAVRGMLFSGLALSLGASLFGWEWMIGLGSVFVIMGALAYLVLAYWKPDEKD